MGSYIHKNIGGSITRIQEVRIVEKEVEIDILAAAVAKALAGHLSNSSSITNITNITNVQDKNNNLQNSQNRDTFDDSKTMENLAKSMLVNRDEKKSNLENINNNNTKESKKKDNKETDKTIDLLSQLND